MTFYDFALQFIRYPKDIGSIVPSSRWLARSMVEAVDIASASSIVEFGSGNGIVTREILKRKTANTKLYAVELDEVFRPYLDTLQWENYFPLYMDVLTLDREIHPGSVDVIYSCLPLGSFSPMMVDAILQIAHKLLKPGGKYVQFQYFLQNKKDVAKYFTFEKTGLEVRNIPPAFIYTTKKV